MHTYICTSTCMNTHCTYINKRYILCPQGTTQDNIVGYVDTHSNLNHKVTCGDCWESIPAVPLLLCPDICSLVGMKPRQGWPSALARLNASLPCPPLHRMQCGTLSSNSWQQTWAWITAGLPLGCTSSLVPSYILKIICQGTNKPCIFALKWI